MDLHFDEDNAQSVRYAAVFLQGLIFHLHQKVSGDLTHYRKIAGRFHLYQYFPVYTLAKRKKRSAIQKRKVISISVSFMLVR